MVQIICEQIAGSMDVAGDWIKMRKDLRDDPAVISMTLALRISADSIVGKLHRIWSWADSHSTDGTVVEITMEWIDRHVGKKGFADAMCNAGWLLVHGWGIEFPLFERHNGESAKSRCEAQERQRKSRKRHASVTENCDNTVTKSVTREEKRREDKRNTNTYSAAAERVYQLYPRKVGPAKAKAAIEKALRLTTEDVLSEAVRAFAASPAGNAGQFTPHPATWFNQRRWEDDRSEWNRDRSESNESLDYSDEMNRRLGVQDA